LACAVLVTGVVTEPAVAHQGGKAEPLIAAAVDGKGLVRTLTVRLTDVDSRKPVAGATVTVTAEMTRPHTMTLAPWALAEQRRPPGTYRARVRFPMAARWTVTIAVTGAKVVAARSQLVMTTRSTRAATQPSPTPQLEVLPTRLGERLQESDLLSIVVLWLHALSAFAWMVGVVVMALALTARPGVLAERIRLRLASAYREWGALVHWSLVPAIVLTGIYNMLEVTPFPLVWRPGELERLADIPYGVLYETILLLKLGLFAALLITGTQLLVRTLREEPSAFTPQTSGPPGFAATLVSALGAPGLLYLACMPLIAGAAAALRYVHVLSHVGTVLSNS
jgi:hypothetical protein